MVLAGLGVLLCAVLLAVMVGRPAPSSTSVWDKAAVAAAFQQAGVKPSHLTSLYKYVLQQTVQTVITLLMIVLCSLPAPANMLC